MKTKPILIIGIGSLDRLTESQRQYFQEVLVLTNSIGLVPFASINDKRPIQTIKKSSIDNMCIWHSNRELFMLLSQEEKVKLDSILGNKYRDCIKGFSAFYATYDLVSSASFYSALHRITRYIRSNKIQEPIYFRSGVAATYGLGLAAAGCHIGSSLAHTNTKQNAKLLTSLLKLARQSPVFIDNGFITMKTQGKKLDVSWVMSEYKSITPLSRSHSRNLTFVIPDAPGDNAAALNIIERNRDDILWLLQRVELILPIHRCDDIQQHALGMLAALGFPTNIRLGVPCLKNKGKDLEISVSDIEKLLMLKNPRTNKPAFQKVHMLGISDVTDSMKLQPRLLLMRLYNIDDCTADSSRFTALFGKLKSGGPRKGSAVVIKLEEDHKRKQITGSKPYQEYSYERDSFGSDPISLMDDFYELISEDDIHTFWALFNALVSDEAPALCFHFDERDCKYELIELAWQVVGYSTVPRLLFEQYKRINWRAFETMVSKTVTISELSYFEKRFDALKTLFAKDTTNPVQLPLL